MKLKKLLEHTLGDLPSDKLMKMKWNPVNESEPVNEAYIQQILHSLQQLVDQCKGYKAKKALQWAQKYPITAGNKSFQETIDRITKVMKKFN